MILRSYSTKLVSIAFALVSVGLGSSKAIAQTTYPFNGNYDTVINIVPITEDISQSFELARSTDADPPYGLTQYQGIVYAKNDPATGEITFDTNPATFGLPDLPLGSIVFEGEGTDNKLRGTATATAVLDLENLTGKGFGTLNITGGEGLFTNATGILDFSETDTLNPDPSVLSLNGKAVITGSIEVVPEPSAEMGTLVGISLIGATTMLRRHRRRSTTQQSATKESTPL